MKEIKQETNRPKGNLPYQGVNRPFRMQFVVPGPGITIKQDKNGILYISAQGGSSVSDIIAGDNIEIEHREDGSVVISAVNSVANISAGENVTITVDPETGASVINSIIGGETNEHYKGVFDTTEDLIAADPEPEIGDYGLIKSLTITNGETSWSGQYKYCFFINGAWTVVDQMLTFTKNIDLLQQYYSVGGSSPVIYLHEIARTGNFWDLNNIPIVATPEVTVEGTTVTATCATEGAEIWYSTDGSMPHVNGTKYTGPITASGATTYRFVGIKNGMINSLEAVASSDYELQAPVIELDWHTGEISMTNPNQDGNGNPVGDIYFNGTGHGDQTLYTGPMNMRGTSRVNWTAKVVYGNEESPETVCDFVACPALNTSKEINWNTGHSFIKAFFRNGHFDGEIRYTTNGLKPEYTDQTYESPIGFELYDAPQYIWVCGFAEGFIPNNGVKMTNIGYDSPSAPGISYNPDSSEVTLTRTGNTLDIPLGNPATPENINCRIYYTLDGSTPTDQSTLYTGPFQISGNTTVKAVLIAYGQYSSDVAELEIQMMDAPQFSLDWHTGRVTMTNPNDDGSIYYTLDGSEPTASSNVYSAPVTLTNNTTVKAKVIAGTGSSATATQTFTRAQAPTINNGNTSLTYNLNILTGIYDVNMNTSQQGGIIRYTSLSQGYIPNNPTWSDNQFVDELSAPFFEEWVFKARTFAEGFIPSSVVTVDFGLNSVHPVLINYDETKGIVSFQRQWFTAQIPLQTNNNTPELGCRVYYTLDGSTPDDKSTLWDGNPVSVDPGTTVKALLVCYGQYESEVATYNVPKGMEYMYLEAVQANSTVSMVSTLETAPNLEYSTDGVTWKEWPHTTAEGTHTFDTINLAGVGDKVYFRGDNPNGLAFLPEGSMMPNFSNFALTGAINGGGNIMSLLDADMELTEVPQFGFVGLFANISGVLQTTPSMVTITTIGDYGCNGMYSGQTSLKSAADMPVLTIIGDRGCAGMYVGCTSLESAADMPILTTIGVGGCGSMYATCYSLTSASDMPVLTNIGEGGCEDMYDACTFDMSDDGTTLNFAFPTPPVTAGETTYATAYDVAEWMGNTNGFGGYED